MRNNNMHQTKSTSPSVKLVVLIITLSFVFSYISLPVLSDPIIMTPQPIYGAAQYSTGGPADGAYVEVSSSLGTVTTYVGPAGGWNSGYWQVDVGDPGQNWPDGTSFTVTITNATGWKSNPVTDIIDPSGNNMGTIILLPPSVNATASATPTTVEIGNPVDFTGSATGGVTPYTWSWEFGDGDSSMEQNPSHSYSSTGTFTATLTVTDDLGSTKNDTVAITVYAKLIVETDGPYEATVDENISFNSTVNGGNAPYSYKWDLGNGQTKTGQNILYTYTEPGIYTITLTVEDNEGITESVETTATIYTDHINVGISAPSNATATESVQFSGTASNGVEPYNWSWDFGDGNTATEQNPTHIYESQGNYTITLNVTDALGISNATSTTILIFKKTTLDVDIGGPYESVVNYPVSFSGSVGDGAPPFHWYWKFGDGATSTEQYPEHTYDTPGQYTVFLTVTDNEDRLGEVNTTVSITQNYPPARPTVGGTFKGKEDRRYTYTLSTNDPDGDTIYYYIDWGDGENSGWLGPYNSGEQARASHTWNNDGSYVLKVKAKDPYDAESDWTTNEVIMPINYGNPFINLLEQLSMRFPFLEPFFSYIINILSQ